MAARDHNGDEQPSRAGYLAAILISALGHVAIIALVVFVAPMYMKAPEAAPPAYTVKIVDDIPAGDLGTHLPRINRNRKEAKAEPKPEEPKVKIEEPKPPELAPDDDKNAIALNTKIEATLTPTPTPEPTPEPTVQPTPVPTERAKPTPKETHTPHAKGSPKSSLKSSPQPAKRAPKSAPSIVIAKAESTPSVEDRLATVKRKLLEEHLKNEKKRAAEDDDRDDEDTGEEAPPGPKGGGPVAGKVASAGRGMGIGPGTGSAGIQQDLDFLLYYQTVQDQIKKAWNFYGGSNELTATVDFSIGPDGALTAVKIGKSSKDSAFDDSVIRAIRRAAPFPPPPDKFRDRFGAGIEALFQLGELKS
ncbi:MAG: cell envelope integrity protein TolA [Candidatus Binatus sp.]|uniref:cell envelope integrity protein TolA n=1 Tax=Candidatus Binatus sp. TaxID=2811406 RepID=UPI0027237007|nr:cell envelope integrity protein TolA [Candidatus Binatus sp.]MDO8433693.1 cell envelope integrity protein TolA [Candidatus Binatus sp.]